MRNPNGFRVVLFLIPLLCLLWPVAIITFVLERISNSYVNSATRRNWRDGSNQITLHHPNSQGSTDTVVNLDINSSPSLAILGVCAIAYIVGTLGLFGIWELRKVEGTYMHQRVWSWIVILSNMILIGTSVGVLVYASSLQSNERGWQSYADVSNHDNQEFTKETWACQIARLFPDEQWAGPACGTTKATRFLLIPLAISSVLVLLSLWLLLRERGGIKWLFGGKGRYGGFPSVYELQPTAPSAVPLAPGAYHQPPQHWQPYPPQQWQPYGPPQWQPCPQVYQPMQQPHAQQAARPLEPQPQKTAGEERTVFK